MSQRARISNPVKRINKVRLPRYWRELCPEAIDLWDISFQGSSVKVKLILFSNKADANRFTRRLFGYKWVKDCLGLNMDLSYKAYDYSNGRKVQYVEYDKNYNGVIILLKDHLSLEVIAHECCHAALAYDRRLKGKKWPDSDRNPDEGICYPLGKLVAQVCSALKSGGHTITGNHGVLH